MQTLLETKYVFPSTFFLLAYPTGMQLSLLIYLGALIPNLSHNMG